jgi:8-oxo-dGTP diphosphatase
MLEFGNRLANVNYVERPGAYAVIRNPMDDVAIIRTPRGCFLPGGGVDAGEDMVAALRREIYEETGLGVEIAREVGVAAQFLSAPREGVYYKKVGHFFLADFAERLSETFEAEHELLWMSQQQASNALNHQFQVWALEQAQKILKQQSA